MKNSILTLLLIFVITIKVNAQEKLSNTQVFIQLLESRENDFKDIMKEKMNNASSNPAEVSYASKIGFGAAKESVNIDETNKTAFFMSYFDYETTTELNKSMPVLDDLIKIINSPTVNKLYKITDITAQNGDIITQVNDQKDNMVMSMTTTSGNKAFYIIFFGKSFNANK
jgi:hypothetical protein